MRRSKKILITATCVLLLILIGGSLFVYERIEQIFSAPDLQQLLDNNTQDKLTTFNSPKEAQNSHNIISQERTEEHQSNAAGSDSDEKYDQTQAIASQSKSLKASGDIAAMNNSELSNKMAGTIQQEIGVPVETGDLLKAGFILMNKLSSDEINFLFGFSDKKYTKEELKEARKLLLSKLTVQDIATLKALAEKYGKNLYILDPNVPIK